jgi:hypothetical protein
MATPGSNTFEKNRPVIAAKIIQIRTGQSNRALP